MSRAGAPWNLLQVARRRHVHLPHDNAHDIGPVVGRSNLALKLLQNHLRALDVVAGLIQLVLAINIPGVAGEAQLAAKPKACVHAGLLRGVQLKHGIRQLRKLLAQVVQAPVDDTIAGARGLQASSAGLPC